MPTAAGQSGKKDDGGLHRLTDMEVEEVSFVDRGANKKCFVVVKRDEGGEGSMSLGELVPDGRGGFKRVNKASKKSGEEEETDKAKKPPFGGKAPPFGKKPPEDDEEEETEKAAGDEEDEEETEKARGAGMLEEVTESIELLMEVAEKLKGEDLDGDGEEGEFPPGELKDSMKRAYEKLGGILEKAGVKKVEKAGRRMSKERLDRFKGALESLNSILKEVMSSPELKDAEKRGPALMKALRKAMIDPSDVGNERVEELLGAVEELTGVVKQQKSTIALLKKGGATSNAASVEKSDRGGGDRGDGVEWPLDLNSPIDRGHTDKEMSFYDE